MIDDSGEDEPVAGDVETVTSEVASDSGSGARSKDEVQPEKEKPKVGSETVN
jgi:hypothetical protein